MWPVSRTKWLLRRFDHAAIFLLIAGTYTPFTLGPLLGPWGWSLFAWVWTGAIGGIPWKAVALGRAPIVSVLLYVGMGWSCLIAFKPLVERLPQGGVLLLVAGALGIWLFYVQHQFEDAYWERQDAWDADTAAIQGSSFYDLPRFMHWFTGNIGFHHIHHLASKIPNYRLREAFDSSPALQKAPRLSIRESFRCARLKLWDEQKRRLVGFPRRRQTVSA